MSDQIKNSDIFSDDLFTKEIEKAKLLETELTKLQEGFKALARETAKEINGVGTKTVADVTKLNEALAKTGTIEAANSKILAEKKLVEEKIIDLQNKRAENAKKTADKESAASTKAAADAVKAADKKAAAEEKAAQQAQKANERAAAAKERADKKAAKEAEKLNRQIQLEAGLLGGIQAQMKRLEASKPFAKTEAEVAKINKQLEGLKQRYNQINNTGKQATNTFGNALGSFQFKFNFLGNLFAQATSGIADTVFNFGKEAVQIAAKAEGIERAFKRLNNPQLLDQLRKATQGTVSDLSLMQGAVKANNFKIPLDQLAKLFKFAQIRAQETGESVDYLTESIVLGISRKSIPILDNLGLSAAQIQQEFKKTGDFAKGVGNIIDEELKKAGDQSLTTAGKIQRLSATWENFKELVGKYLIDEGVKILDSFDLLTGKVTIVESAFRMLNNNLAETAVKQHNAFLETIKEGNAQQQLADAYGRRVKLLDEHMAQLTQFNKESKTWTAEQVVGAELAIKYTEKRISLISVFIDEQTKLLKKGTQVTDTSNANLKSNFELEKILAQERFDLQKKAIENSAMQEDAAHVAMISSREQLANKLADIEIRAAREDAAFRRKDIEAAGGDEAEKATKILEINHNLAQDIKNIKEKQRIDIAAINEQEIQDAFDAAVAESERQNAEDIAKAKKAKERAEKLAQDKLDVQEQLFEVERRQLERERATGLISETKYAQLEVELLRDAYQRRSQVIIDAQDKELTQIEADYSAKIITLEEYETRKRKVVESAGVELEALTDDIAKKEYDIRRKHIEQFIEDIDRLSDAVADGAERRFDAIQSGLERESEKIADQLQVQQDLFARGLQNTLAFQEAERAKNLEKQAELEKKKRKVEEAQQLANLFLELFGEYVKNGDPAAAGKALAQTLVAKGISNAIAGSAEEGTEDTGKVNGKGLDGRGGRLWMLHDNEAVIKKDANKSAPGLAAAWNDGRLNDYFKTMYQPQYEASMPTAAMPVFKAQDSTAIDAFKEAAKDIVSAVKNKKEIHIGTDVYGQIARTEFENGMRKKYIQQKRRF